MSQRLQPCGVELVLHEVVRAIEIHIVVSVAAGEGFDIVEAAHAYHAVNEVRVAKGEIDGVIRSKACTCSDQERVRVMLGGKREDFIQDIAVILDVSPRSFSRWPPFVIPS